MFGIGFGEWIFIGAVALVIMGPERFPELAKLFIRTTRDLRGYWDDIKDDISKEMKPVKKELTKLSRLDSDQYLKSLGASVDLKEVTKTAAPPVAKPKPGTPVTEEVATATPSATVPEAPKAGTPEPYAPAAAKEQAEPEQEKEKEEVELPADTPWSGPSGNREYPD